MSRALSLLFAVVLACSASVAFAQTTYHVDPAGDNTNTGLAPGDAFQTLAHAATVINGLSGTDEVTIALSAGTHAVSATVNINRGNFKLIGASESTTTIDCSSVSSSYCIHVDQNPAPAENVVFSDFTLVGANAYAANTDTDFDGDLTFPDPSNAVPDRGLKLFQITNLVIERVTGTQFRRSPFDLHGTTSASVKDVTATLNGGHGFTLTDNTGLVLEDIVASYNKWSGVSLSTYGRYYGAANTANVIKSGDVYRNLKPLQIETNKPSFNSFILAHNGKSYSSGQQVPVTFKTNGNAGTHVLRELDNQSLRTWNVPSEAGVTDFPADIDVQIPFSHATYGYPVSALTQEKVIVFYNGICLNPPFHLVDFYAAENSPDGKYGPHRFIVHLDSWSVVSDESSSADVEAEASLNGFSVACSCNGEACLEDGEFIAPCGDDCTSGKWSTDGNTITVGWQEGDYPCGSP